MNRSLLGLALVPFVIGCAAAYGGVPSGAPSALACEVRATPIPDGLRLEAVVFGEPSQTGEYQLQLSKSGSGGTSQVAQGGEFVIGPDGEVVAGLSELSLTAGDDYRVTMTVAGPDETADCRQTSATDRR